MTAQVSRILRRYGRPAAVHRGEDVWTGSAMVQPILDRERQWTPSPLGRRRQDRFLYLGEPGPELDRLGEDGYIEWDGHAYDVVSAHPVELGARTLYWWAVLRARERGRGEECADGGAPRVGIPPDWE